MEQYKGIYFENEQSMAFAGADICNILRTVSYRYMSNNIAEKLKLRSFWNGGFCQEFSSCFLMDFNEKFPKAKEGAYAYAFSYAYAKKEYCALMKFEANSPAWIYLNGELIFETSVDDEALKKSNIKNILLKKGKNIFFVKCKKNALGFGCKFGDGKVYLNATTFINPTAEHRGKNGWAYTAPFENDIFADCKSFPEVGAPCGDIWLPPSNIRCDLNIGEVLNSGLGYAYAMTFLKNPGLKKTFNFKGNSSDPCKIYVDGKLCFEGMGSFEFSAAIDAGQHRVLAEINHNIEKKLLFSLDVDGEFSVSDIVYGCRGNWMFLGYLKEKCPELIKEFVYEKLYDGIDGKVFWHTSEENTDIRLTAESDSFGRWTYPIGVMLYGLSRVSKKLNDEGIYRYAQEHMRVCVDSYEYAKWDTDKYGRAGLDQQLMEMSALDFCGSCGNAMLELMEYKGNTKVLADIIADYIENHQERLENGMFYRHQPGTIHENSIWADDLYMSVPFLCRYYKATGNIKYLDDAVNQFEHYKEYLFMPEKKVMSHVYKLKYKQNNKIPWGRGNGWVVFALSELLCLLPDNHLKRKFLIKFFCELCEGYIALQDECGIWHQILDEKDAYMETSATAMFIIAFARGVKNGWLCDKKFAEAAFKGWEGLCRYCIDSTGDLYAICVGSALSYRREYYMNKLRWNVNDTHGIGIVLLAGCELLDLMGEV